MNSSFSARYYPKGSGKPRAVTVSLTDGILQVTSETGEIYSIPLSDIDLRAGGFQGDRIILHSRVTGESLASKDKAFLIALKELHHAGRLQGDVSEASKRLWWTPFRHITGWIAVLVCLGVATALLYLAADSLIEVAAGKFPRTFDKRLGDIAFARCVDEDKLDKKKAEVQRVRALGKKLLDHADTSGYGFEFHVVDDKELNAFSLPGGKIVIYSELVRELKSNDELAGVLAHEISHVILRHGMHQALHKSGLSATIEALWANDPRLVGGKLARLLEFEELSYSRKQEEEADRSGLQLLIKAGFPPNGLLRFLERIDREYGSNQKMRAMFSTHPDPDKRIESIKLEMNKMGIAP